MTAATTMTTEDAITHVLVTSMAPGQFDDITTQLSKLNVSVPNMNKLKKEHLQFQVLGLNTDNVTHPLAGAVVEQVSKYQQKCFASKSKKVKARVAVTVEGCSNPETQFIVHSYAEKKDDKNMQTAFWKTTWMVTATSDQEALLEGTIRVHTYMYEDGNTQLQITKHFESTKIVPVVSVVDGKKDGKGKPALEHGIVRQIQLWEHLVLSILKGLPDASMEELRQIRRVLPVQRTKMKWQIEAQRSVAHLKKTAANAQKK